MPSKKRKTFGEEAKTLKFTLRPNPFPSTAKDHKYFAKAIPNGVVDIPTLAADMAADGCKIGSLELEYYFAKMFSLAMELIREEHRAVDLGFCTLRPVLKGGFDYLDAPFDPERNKLVVEVELAKPIKDAVKELKPVNVTPVDVPAPRIDSVCQAPDYARNAIAVSEPFEIHGTGLTVGCGDETAELELSSGAKVPVELKPQTKMDGSRCVKAQLAGSLPSPCPKRGRVFFSTHGLLGKSSPLVTVRSAMVRLMQ